MKRQLSPNIYLLPMFLLFFTASFSGQIKGVGQGDFRPLSSVLASSEGIAYLNTIDPTFRLHSMQQYDKFSLEYAFLSVQPSNLDGINFQPSANAYFSPQTLPGVRGYLVIRLVKKDQSREVFLGPYQIDNEMPPKPVITGVTQGERRATEPVVGFRFPDNMACEYRILRAPIQQEGAITDQNIDPPEWKPYVDPLVFQRLENTETRVFIGYRISSRAGLVREESVAIDFMIDRRSPVISGLAIGGQAITLSAGTEPVPISLNKSATLRIDLDEEAGIYLTENSGTPVLLTAANSAVYEIAVDSATETVKHFSLQAVDAAGNKSLPVTIKCLIDSKPPMQPAPPVISRDANTGTITWILPSDGELWYTMVSDPDDGGEYQKAQTATSWTIDAGINGLILRYKTRDGAGNETAGEAVYLAYIKFAEKPTLDIPEGLTISPRNLLVKRTDNLGIIRYSMSQGDTSPPEVSASSQAFSPRGVNVAAADGDEQTYHFRFRRFMDGYEPSVEYSCSIKIDKKKPDDLVFPELFSTNYLTEAVRIKSRMLDDGAVFYRIDRFDPEANAAAALSESGSNPTFMAMDEDIIIDPTTYSPGSTVRFQCYARDSAGNQSGASSFIFVMEPDTLYLDAAVSLPAAVQNGSRTTPFNNLTTAMEVMKKKPEKKTLVMAAGNYPLIEAVHLQTEFSIEGGRASGTWIEQNAESVIYPARNYAADNLFMVEDGGKVKFSHVYFSDSGRNLKSLIHAKNSSLDFMKSQLSVTASVSALTATASHVNSEETRFSCNDPVNVRLVTLDKCQAVFANTIFESSNLPDPLMKNVGSSEYILLEANDSTVSLPKSTLNLCRGRVAIGIMLNSSQVDAGGLTMNETRGAIYSTFFHALNQSHLTLREVTIMQSGYSTVATIAKLFDSTMVVEQSKLQGRAVQSAIGIKAVNSGVEITDCQLTMSGAQDYQGLLTLEQANLKMSGSTIQMSNCRDNEVLFARFSSSVLRENSLSFSSGNRTIAFKLFDEGKHFLQRNVLRGDLSSILFSASDDAVLDVRENIMEAWFALLSMARSGKAGDEILYKDLRDLEAMHGDSIFEGNRIRQGL